MKKLHHNSTFAILFAYVLFSCLIMSVNKATAADSGSKLLYNAAGQVAGYDLSGYDLASNLTFIQDHSRLMPGGQEVLDEVYRRLQANPTMKISIYGYTDATGPPEWNMTLSLIRAQAVEAALIRMGLSPDRIVQVKAMGGADPIADNSTDAGRIANRRVEVHIEGMTLVRQTALPAASKTEIPTPAPTPLASPEPEPSYQRFAIGLGYPDVRARLDLGRSWAVEAKFTLEQDIQIYSGRVYWDFLDLGPLMVELGAEGGVARFNGLDTLDGTGGFGEGFLCLEYPIGNRMRLAVDGGPARVAATSDGYTYTQNAMVFDAALYVYVF